MAWAHRSSRLSVSIRTYIARGFFIFMKWAQKQLLNLSRLSPFRNRLVFGDDLSGNNPFATSYFFFFFEQLLPKLLSPPHLPKTTLLSVRKTRFYFKHPLVKNIRRFHRMQRSHIIVLSFKTNSTSSIMHFPASFLNI